MNKQNTEFLYTNYPKFFSQHSKPMTETCMCWGIECGDGWFEIIKTLAEKIEKLNNTRYIGREIEATQVKEKFGELRVYLNQNDDTTDEIIEEATSKSCVTCENCGSPDAYPNSTGWISTLCKNCHEKRYENNGWNTII